MWLWKGVGWGFAMHVRAVARSDVVRNEVRAGVHV